MRRRRDVPLGVVTLATASCLAALLLQRCPRSLACMGPASAMRAGMGAPTGEFLGLLGLAAAGAVAARTTWILATTRRACAALVTVATPRALARSMARTGVRPVRCVRSAPVAVFCHGVLRPTVVVEVAALTTLRGPALDAVLLHEDAHRRHHDPLRRALRRALQDAGCRGGLLAWWSSRAVVLEELRADAWAAQRVGKPAIARALLSIGTGPRMTTTPGFTDAADARVSQLLGDSPRLPGLPAATLVRPALCLAVLAALALCTALSAV